jgi:hypothetical protein
MGGGVVCVQCEAEARGGKMTECRLFPFHPVSFNPLEKNHI